MRSPTLLAAVAMLLPAGVAPADQTPVARILGCNVSSSPGLARQYSSLDQDGWRAVLGAPTSDSALTPSGFCQAPPPPAILECGAAFVFEFDGAKWAAHAMLLAADAAGGDQFGADVAVAGDLAAVGAPGRDGGIGAVYVFEKDADGRWLQTVVLAPPLPLLEAFGTAVDFDGDTLVVGASGAAHGAAAGCDPGDETFGAAYAYRRQAPLTWALEQTLYGCPRAIGDDEPPPFCGPHQEVNFVHPAGFGRAVSISGERLVVGAPGADVGAWCPPAGPGAGSAHAFERDAGGTWSEVMLLLPHESQAEAAFGAAVAIDQGSLDEGSIVVGQPFFTHVFYEDGVPVDAVMAGAAYLYDIDRSGAPAVTFFPQDFLDDEPPVAGMQFGASVAVDHGCTILAGAPGDTALGANGSAYRYTRLAYPAAHIWPLADRLVQENPDDTPAPIPVSGLGSRVAVDGRAALALATIGPVAGRIAFHYVVPEAGVAAQTELDDGFDGPCLEWSMEPLPDGMPGPGNPGYDEYICPAWDGVGGAYHCELDGSALVLEDLGQDQVVLAKRALRPPFDAPYTAIVGDSGTYAIGFDARATIAWNHAAGGDWSDARLDLKAEDGLGLVSVGITDGPAGLPQVIGVINSTGVPGDGSIQFGPGSLPLGGEVEVRIRMRRGLVDGHWFYGTDWRLPGETRWQALPSASGYAFRRPDAVRLITRAHATLPYGPIAYRRVRVEVLAGAPFPPDVNRDGVVDVEDLIAVVLAWGFAECDGPADVDGDGVVDVNDLVEVVLNWGPVPDP